jgi:hypothetical protein
VYLLVLPYCLQSTGFASVTSELPSIVESRGDHATH